MAEDDDEFLAFQAEMAKMSEAPKQQTIGVVAAGPRAPKVISAAPSGPTPVVPETAAPSAAAFAASSKLEPSSSYADEAAPSFDGGAASSAKPPETAESMGLKHFGVPGSSSASLMPSSEYRPPSGFPPMGGPVGGAPPPPPQPQPPKAAGKEKAGKEAEKAAITKRFCAGAAWEDKTLADWPEDDFRIFVGDLGNETNDDVLAHAFARYPSFQKARVVRNKNTQKSMGYGFVSFKDPWDMTKSLREMHGKYIGNRPVKVRKSTWKERSSSDKDWNHSLAVTDKRESKKHKTNPDLHKPHVSKKKKGMPW